MLNIKLLYNVSFWGLCGNLESCEHTDNSLDHVCDSTLFTGWYRGTILFYIYSHRKVDHLQVNVKVIF